MNGKPDGAQNTVIIVSVKPIEIAIPNGLTDLQIADYLDQLDKTPVVVEWDTWKYPHEN